MNSLACPAGSSIAIFGGGPVGLAAVMGAVIQGCSTIILVEPIAARRAIATELGATHVIDPKTTENVLEAIKELSGGEWTSHDLRKLARTVWAEIGIDYLVGEMLLNHSVGTLAKTYIRTTADQLRREALERWHAWLDARGFTAAHGLKSEQTGISTNAA